MQQMRFNYKTLQDFTADLVRFAGLPISTDVSVLQTAVSVGTKAIHNGSAFSP